MKKGVILALLILGVCILVLIFNRGTVSVDLLLFSISGMKALVFLAWMAIGVVIGVLVK
jgi:hypothetical protein